MNDTRSVLCWTFWAAAITATGAAVADPWPQFRGPLRDGISAEAGIRRAWTESGPTELWRRPIGPAFSGLSVVGTTVYTMTSNDTHEIAVALDSSTGAERWRTVIGEVFVNEWGDGPRSTPTFDDGRLYVVSSLGGLTALDAADGAVLWQVDFQERFGSELPVWAFSCSPLVVGDRVIAEVGGPDGHALAAFDAETGATAWTAYDGTIAYSSPVRIEFEGVEQLVFLTHEGLLSLDADGKEIWRHEFEPELGIKPAMPVFVAPDLIFASASYDAGAVTLRLGKTGEKVGVTEVWTGPAMRNHFNSSVELGGHLYGFDKATFKCIDAATGEVLWAKRGLGKGSLILAGDLLVVLSERGRLLLVEASPEEYRELAAHDVLSGRSWTQPSLADGRLYLRNLAEIVALEVSDDA